MISIHLKDIKKDQVFYERTYGSMLKLVAQEDAYESGSMEIDGKSLRQWSCRAKNFQTGEEINYLTTENCEHYGAKLYVESPNAAKPEWKVTKLSSESEWSENNIQSETVMIGELMIEPAVDGILFLVEQNGLMIRTSKIIQIDETGGIRIIHTRNSKYKLEKL